MSASLPPVALPSFLHIEDDAFDAELVANLVRAEWPNCTIRLVASEADAAAAVKTGGYDLVLSDFSMPGFDGLAALALVRRHAPDTPFIFLSGTIGEDKAVEALKRGATDYIIKDRMNRLVPAVRRALSEVRQTALRRKAEERLREQARWLDGARDAICVTNLAGQLTYWNHSAARLFGWSDRVSPGRRLEDMLGLFNQAILAEAITQVGIHGAWRGELQLASPTGDMLTVESRWTMVRDPAGRPDTVLLINTNVTDRRQLETQLRRAQRLDSLGMLAGGIAHDLNNLLAPIQIAVDLLRAGSDDPEVARLTDLVTHSVERGGALIRQVLAFARGAEGDKQPLQVGLVIKDVARLMEETLPRSIELNTRVPPELWLVRADATQLSQVLMNLCVNARDALPVGGHLLIQAANIEIDAAGAETKPGLRPGPHIVVTVEDTGTGMPPEIVDRIFDPFFTTKSLGKGTGLGLSTALGIVKNHGGFISVTSEPGRGSAFQLFFPAVFDAVVPRAPEQRSVKRRGRGQTLLVIDDEKEIGDLMQAYLNYHGYRAIVAASGSEGVELYRRHAGEVQAILTDMMMPGLQPAEIVAALRAINPAARIILMSGMVGPDGDARVAALNCAGFLQKPMTGDEVASMVESVLAAGG